MKVVEKNITWKKVEGMQYYHPYDFKAVGKNIKWARRDGGLKIWGIENNVFKKMGVRKNIKL